MKLTIHVTATTVDGPRASAEAVIEAIEDELEGYRVEAQNPSSEDVSVVELSISRVTR